MSEIEAEQRRMRKRQLEEQLRLLEDEERQYRAAERERLATVNTPVTSSGSYPPQWSATISKPSTASSSSSSRHVRPLIVTSGTGDVAASSSAWPSECSHRQRSGQATTSSQTHTYSNPYGYTQSTAQSQSQSQSHRPPSIGSVSRNHQSCSAVQSHPHSHPSQRHARTSHNVPPLAGPSSSISPQIAPASPTPTTATPTASSHHSVALPSAQQLHDWLRDHAGQSKGLDTEWSIQGKRVDMYSLLSAVIRAGGSTEVSSRDWWPTLAGLLRLVDENTPTPIRAAMGKQLQEFFLKLLGGLEILWERTKIAEQAQAANVARQSVDARTASESLPTPTTASLQAGPSSSGAYGQQTNGSAHRKSQNTTDSTTHPKPPASNRTANVNPSWATSQSVAQPAQPTRAAQSEYSGSSAGSYWHPTSHSSQYQQQQHRPSSAASSTHTQQSPNIPSQFPLHQPTPLHPTPHRLPDLLSFQRDRDRSQGPSPVQSHLSNPISGNVTRQQPQSVEAAVSGQTQPQPQLQPRLIARPSEPQSGKFTQLVFGGKNLGDYLVPRLSSFRELVSSNILALPKLSTETQALNGTWSGDEYVLFSKRCHELGHAVRKLQAGQPTRQISKEEIIFWAKLLTIMRHNPTVLPPPMDDRPASISPTSAAPADLVLPAPASSSQAERGTFDNPVSIAAPELPFDGSPASQISDETSAVLRGMPTKRGRPKGSKNRPKDPNQSPITSGTDTPVVKKKRSKEARMTVPSHDQSEAGPSTQAEPAPSQSMYSSQAEPLGPFEHPLESQSQGHPLVQIEILPAASQIPSTGIDGVPKKKRGRPKGSKTVNRNVLPGQRRPSKGSSKQHGDSSIAHESTILVAASQPESISHFGMLDRLTQSENPSPMGLEDIFHPDNHTQVSQFPHNAEVGPSSVHTLSQSMSAPPDGSSQPTGTSGTGPRVITQAHKEALSKAGRIRWQRFREAQGILNPPKQKTGRGKAVQSGDKIPLVQDLSPRKRIDLSGNHTAAAQLRTIDSPTRFVKRSPPGHQQASYHRPPKKQKTSHLFNSVEQQPTFANGTQDIDSFMAHMGPDFIPDDLPIPDVSELAKALVGTVLSADLSQFGAGTMEEGEEEIVAAEAGSPQSAGAGKKRGRGRPRKRSSFVGRGPRPASVQPGEATIDLTTARSELPARANSALPFTPRRRGVPVVELPSSKRVKVKVEKGPAPSVHSEDIPIPSSVPRTRSARNLSSLADQENVSPAPVSKARSRRSLVSEHVPEPSPAPVLAIRSRRSVGSQPPSARASSPMQNRTRKSMGPQPTPLLSPLSAPPRSRRSLGSQAPPQSQSQTTSVPAPRSLAAQKPKPKRLSVQIQPTANAASQGKVTTPVKMNKPKPKPKRVSMIRQESGVAVDDGAESDLEPQSGTDSETNAESGSGSDAPSETVRSRKKAVRGPVDRAKVVIPIRRKRRAILIERGAYNAFRDDDSDTELNSKRRAHVGQRPTRFPTQRSSRSFKPSEPEPIPLRFLVRPGPATIEPYASVLTEKSLMNRAVSHACGWKGCDAVLASEELLRRHVDVGGHAKQGKEQVEATHWVWGRDKTTRVELVPDKWVYRCFWRECEGPCFNTEQELVQHMRARHISKILYCPYEGCDLSSPNISHLARHVMKTHDLPTDRPVPLVDLSVRLPPPVLPSQPLPAIARTDKLATPRVLGSSHRSAYHIERIQLKVATHCFAGPDPVIHVEHPRHMLERIDESASLSDSDDEYIYGRDEWVEGRRYEAVVEIPTRRKARTIYEDNGPGEIDTRAVDPQTGTVQMAAEDEQSGLDGDDEMRRDEDEDEAEIEGAMLAVPPTPAPFPVDPDSDEDNVADDEHENGGDGDHNEDDVRYESQTPGYFEVEELIGEGEDEEEEAEADDQVPVIPPTPAAFDFFAQSTDEEQNEDDDHDEREDEHGDDDGDANDDREAGGEDEDENEEGYEIPLDSQTPGFLEVEQQMRMLDEKAEESSNGLHDGEEDAQSGANEAGQVPDVTVYRQTPGMIEVEQQIGMGDDEEGNVEEEGDSPLGGGDVNEEAGSGEGLATEVNTSDLATDLSLVAPSTQDVEVQAQAAQAGEPQDPRDHRDSTTESTQDASNLPARPEINADLEIENGVIEPSLAVPALTAQQDGEVNDGGDVTELEPENDAEPETGVAREIDLQPGRTDDDTTVRPAAYAASPSAAVSSIITENPQTIEEASASAQPAQPENLGSDAGSQGSDGTPAQHEERAQLVAALEAITDAPGRGPKQVQPGQVDDPSVDGRSDIDHQADGDAVREENAIEPTDTTLADAQKEGPITTRGSDRDSTDEAQATDPGIETEHTDPAHSVEIASAQATSNNTEPPVPFSEIPSPDIEIEAPNGAEHVPEVHADHVSQPGGDSQLQPQAETQPQPPSQSQSDDDSGQQAESRARQEVAVETQRETSDVGESDEIPAQITLSGSDAVLPADVAGSPAVDSAQPDMEVEVAPTTGPTAAEASEIEREEAPVQPISSRDKEADKGVEEQPNEDASGVKKEAKQIEELGIPNEESALPESGLTLAQGRVMEVDEEGQDDEAVPSIQPELGVGSSETNSSANAGGEHVEPRVELEAESTATSPPAAPAVLLAPVLDVPKETIDPAIEVVSTATIVETEIVSIEVAPSTNEGAPAPVPVTSVTVESAGVSAITVEENADVEVDMEMDMDMEVEPELEPVPVANGEVSLDQGRVEKTSDVDE